MFYRPLNRSHFLREKQMVLALHYKQVLRFIVQAIGVYVVDILFACKSATEMLFRDKAMESSSSVSSFNINMAGLSNCSLSIFPVFQRMKWVSVGPPTSIMLWAPTALNIRAVVKAIWNGTFHPVIIALLLNLSRPSPVLRSY